MKTDITKIGCREVLSTYVNGFSPEKNLVYHYLNSNNKQIVYLHPDFNIIYWIIFLEIKCSISKNGDLIAFSEKLNLFARTKNNS